MISNVSVGVTILLAGKKHHTRTCKYMESVYLLVVAVLKERHDFSWCLDQFQLIINICAI